jgi:hypothetical protein
MHGCKPHSPKEQPKHSLNLLTVVDIVPSTKKGHKADPSRFNIDIGDGKMMKFKASTPAEGEEWLANLTEWREYFLLHSSQH